RDRSRGAAVLVARGRRGAIPEPAQLDKSARRTGRAGPAHQRPRVRAGGGGHAAAPDPSLNFLTCFSLLTFRGSVFRGTFRVACTIQSFRKALTADTANTFRTPVDSPYPRISHETLFPGRRPRCARAVVALPGAGVRPVAAGRHPGAQGRGEG